MRKAWHPSSGAIFEYEPGMADSGAEQDLQGGLSEQEKRDNVIRLAFGGDRDRYEAFCRLIADVVPPGTTGDPARERRDRTALEGPGAV